MTYIKYKLKISVVILSSILFFAFAADKEGDKNKINKNSNIQAGDAYRLNVNKISLGMNNKGVLADVDVDGAIGGLYDGRVFLYSGGFFMSGYANGVLFGNAMATASRLEDYVPGNIAGSDESKIMYVVNSADEPFGQSWQDWKTAVNLGAYFYDGDKDGIYDPVDKNGNGVWDESEDMPDLLGDETVWCVYNDGLAGPDRADGFRENLPLGIEIRQTVWAYATAGDLGNIIFIRYSMVNKGTAAETLDSVFFGVWADPDLGDPYDDLVGCDTTVNAGFIYNDGSDTEYGADPPAFLIDFFQGPWEFTGNDADTAYNVKGLKLGIEAIPGARNLPLTSFVQYIQGDPNLGDPDNTQQLRNYTLGLSQQGEVVDPCNFEYGTVLNEDCSLINPRFFYSGDPVTLQGWIHSAPYDQRQMSNTGPFKLLKDRPVDIVVAYVGGRANSSLNSLKETKRIDRAAQFVYQNNFNYPSPPPNVEPFFATEDQSITLTWETSPQLTYRTSGRGYDMIFEGYEVYMYNSNSTSELEGGRTNRILIASYDVANDISNILTEDPVSLQRTLIYEKSIQIDSALYSDPITGRLSLKIIKDPFTNAPLIKGKPYFISIVSFALNREEIVKLDALGNYLIPGTAAVGQIATIPTILSDGISSVGVVPGKDTYNMSPSGVEANHVSGSSEGLVTYDIKNRTLANGHEFEVNFTLDSASALYDLYYNVTDLNTNEVVLDSSKLYGEGIINNLFSGAVLNVQWIQPGISSTESIGTTTPWFSLDTVINSAGTFYAGRDVEDPLGSPLAVATSKSKITKAYDMKRVEIRFGQPGKAYRYVRKLTRYTYLGGDSGFVDIPFQAWVKDDKSGEQYQLAIGFTESALAADTLAHADGIYDPGYNVFGSKEYIIVFNSPYDPTGQQYAYTGTGPSWADIQNGYNLATTDPRYNDSLKNIAKSPYFDALYIVGLQRAPGNPLPMTGTYAINVKYPLTPNDQFRFKVDSPDLSLDQGKELFNKVNVFPNPLFAYNSGVSYTGGSADAPYVTFSNLPEEITIKIFTLSGNLIRTLTKNDNDPFLTWDLQNEDGLRVASGMYIAIVSNPVYGEKVLKFAIVMPQKQILKY